MTIARPRIRGGPAGDVGLAALAAVIRYGYAMGHLEGGSTDDETIELFAAFLAGQGPPRRPER